jgi:hypothetical protein
MPYDDLKAYIEHLAEDESVQIDWGVVSPEGIWSMSDYDAICLQIADAVCSGIFQGLELTPYGFTEHRFAKTLRGITYRRNNNCSSYGMKFFPPVPTTIKNQPRMIWIRKYYQ